MIRHATIESWHVVISGFLQRHGAPNGMVCLASQLHYEHASADTGVELRLWDDSMRGLAEKIWLLRPVWQPPRIRIYGYSWGGAAAVKLARELERRTLAVEHIVLCDAVYRHPYWAGNWRAFWPWATLRVPANVRRVDWFAQTRNLPAGHQVRAVDPAKTSVVMSGLLDATHQYMDDHPKFIARAMEVSDA